MTRRSTRTDERPWAKIFRGPEKRFVLPLAIFVLAFGWSQQVEAQGASVMDTLHNLSVSGPGEIKAATETEVCKFCHIPHNPVIPVPLWGHSLTQASFIVPDITPGKGKERVPAPQPDGSSRLCLSCHDGTVALGDLGRGGSIAMAGSPKLLPGRRGFLGTDLSGSHPVSFVYPESDPGSIEKGSDMGLHTRSVVTKSPSVKLDEDSKVQCTTCHDAHSDSFYKEGEVPRFWVSPTLSEVCLTCHVLQ